MISFLFDVTRNSYDNSIPQQQAAQQIAETTPLVVVPNNGPAVAVASSRPRGGFHQQGGSSSFSMQQQQQQQLQECRVSIDHAIDAIGIGWALQGRLAVVTGLLFLVDSMELAIFAFLSKTLDARTTNNYHDDYHIAAVGVVGALVGAIVCGTLGDVVGRAKVCLMVSTVVTISAIGSALWCTTSPSSTTDTNDENDDDDIILIEGLLLSRALVGFGLGGITVPYDLLSEWLANSNVENQGLRRGRVLLLVHTCWSIGTLLIFGLLETQSVLSPQKGQLSGIELWWCAVPALIATLLLVVSTDNLRLLESPRWLLAQNNQIQALRVLRSAANANGKDANLLFPETVQITLYSNESSSSSSTLTSTTSSLSLSQSSNNGIWSLFSCHWFRLASALLCIYFGQAFCYRGAADMLVKTFQQDQHDQRYQAVLSAVSELVAIGLLLLMVDSWGRVLTQMLAYGLAALACLTLAVWYSLPFLENGNVLIALTFVARMMVFGGGCTTWISTSEILKTDIRTTGHALAAGVWGRLGAFCSTVALPAVNDIPILALTIFAGCLWIALASGDIPETRMNEMGRSYNLLGQSERSWGSYREFVRR